MNKSAISKKILIHAVLPEFWPRIRMLVGSGFGYFSFFIAVIFQNTGLLPANHPYLNYQNFGRYGIRHVIAAASNNLVISRQNADKVVIFFTILAGLMILLLQFILMIASLISAPSFAATWTSVFVNTPYGPSQDIALIVLDRVFGVSSIFGAGGFFGSCFSDIAVQCTDIRGQNVYDTDTFPMGFHKALHAMLMFYSFGIAFISGLIIIYFIVAIVGETIVSGTPFGKRFNKAWFLPRMLVFFALIAPITLTGKNAGINGGQFITLAVAKFGSNMATNAWSTFTDTVRVQYDADKQSTIFGKKETLISFPTVPSVAKLGQFMFLVRMCMYAEKILNDVDVVPYLVRETKIDPLRPSLMMGYPFDFIPLISSAGILRFKDAVEFSRYGSVTMRFGEWNPPDDFGDFFMTDSGLMPGSYEHEWGYVKPYCGELTFDFQAFRPVVVDGDTNLGIQENYYLSIFDYLFGDPAYEKAAYCMVKAIIPFDHDPTCVDSTVTYGFNSEMWSAHGSPGGSFPDVTTQTEWLSRELAKNSINYYDALNRYYINGHFTVGDVSYTGTGAGAGFYNDSIIGTLRADYDFSIPDVILKRGWVGMSAYYQRIAEINGLVFGAVHNTPQISKFPLIMEKVAHQHDATDTNPDLSERYNPLLQNGKIAKLPRPGDQYLAAALYSGYKFWDQDNLTSGSTKAKTTNPVIDTINALFGTEGLFDMLNNREVHPLAQLSALGKSLLESSIRNIFVGTSVGLVSDIIEKKFNRGLGSLPKVGGDFATKIGMIGLSMGFMLYYVLPTLPFIYFFFAFGGWIKSIFEAMVAVPLWALAHIKIDGNGLPGPMATNGYFLLFEIFLRPTLIVIGFMASILIFSASVMGLNSIYQVTVLSVAGYDLKENIYKGVVRTDLDSATIDFMRGPIDQLMYTIIYSVIVYMMAMSCFKLVDQIPNSIMRFMGVTVSTFQEKSGDVGADFASRMSNTAYTTKLQLSSAIDRIRGVGSGLSQLEKEQAWRSMGK